MRTTLDIDDEILLAAKELARQRHVAIGKAISDLLRQALTGTSSSMAASEHSVAGFRPFQAQNRVVSNGLIDNLRDEEGV